MSKLEQRTKWRIVAFEHPSNEKSVLYRQKLTTEELLKSVERAVELGSNLMSIRGFYEVDETRVSWTKTKPQSLQ